MTYKTDTLCGMFHKQANRYKNLEMLRGKYDKEGRPQNAWASQSWKDVQDEVVDLGRGLVALGLKPGDRVAVFSENRPRWVIADQAIQACGAVGVPLYSTLTLEELSYMLGDSGARMAIVSTQQKLEMALKAKSHGVPLEAVITMGPIEGQKPECVYTFAEIIGIGKSQASFNHLEDRMSRVTPDDIASIVYTSGTSGRQKGAVLTQKNLVSNIFQNTNSTIFKRLKKLEPHLTHLCHLPLCHAYGRTCDYHVGVLHLGNVLVFAESFEKIQENLLETRPNVVITIPRFFEKYHHSVLSVLSRQNNRTQAFFSWAMRVGKRYTEAMAHARRMPGRDILQFALANALVFNKVRKLSGMDRLVFASSGGGKLSEEVCAFIRALGIQLSEGYGLTETSPTINLNEPEFKGIHSESVGWFTSKMIDWTIDLVVTNLAQGKSPYANPLRALKMDIAYRGVAHRLEIKPGTVGRPVIWTEERIAEDGEVLVKGPQVFQGYWKMPEETKEAFTDDGFFKTGDIGSFDEDGFLRITDRKKEILITSGGKNIPPHPIELALMARPYIEQACLIGDARKYITALICPDIQETKRLAKKLGILAASDQELLEISQIRQIIQKQVDEVNATLPRYAQIKYFMLLDEPFSLETGELTPTFKFKRRVIEDRRKELIEKMYLEHDPAALAQKQQNGKLKVPS